MRLNLVWSGFNLNEVKRMPFRVIEIEIAADEFETRGEAEKWGSSNLTEEMNHHWIVERYGEDEYAV